jgi:hypothetical protein
MRRLGALLGLCLAVSLTGCSDAGEEPAADPRAGWQTVTATDDTFSLQLPPGWTSDEEFLERPVVVAMRGETGGDRVRASSYLDELRAEGAAIDAAGILAGSNVFCERLDGTEVFGEPRVVFDCPRERPGQPTSRRLLVPMTHDGRSVLLLVQTEGDALEDTADLVRPILESWTWR